MAAGLHEHERADLPGGPAYPNADPDAHQFLDGANPHACRHAADAGVVANLDGPDADARIIRLVADQRPVVTGSVGPAIKVLAGPGATAAPEPPRPALPAAVTRQPPGHR
jgi:hypothetical protein